ncbi:hypothetical protein JYP52_22670 [Nitratireductor aquibiodomus]|uniref:hypothetical protein n=1 Tax=Nitratireductor aquibiodomus TaxID=204799 RepID=UPI0019D3FC1F|nr:hypothetical protein [Nitratireductor aquibiodomus]MBN7763946.1 hypothetical protein [Nitratireductor aquibiodomus]
MSKSGFSVVYVVGAGLSAGLGFPTVANLLPELWGRLDREGVSDLEDVVRFHHPDFNAARDDTYPTIEQLLSEMQANADLFDSTRPAAGGFTSVELKDRHSKLLHDLATWFHELKRTALRSRPEWLDQLVAAMKNEQAAIISFNWDLILDQLLFGEELDKASYGLDRRRTGVRLIKPHGSLNWYKSNAAAPLKESKKFALTGDGTDGVFAFRPLRAPISRKGRQYMPLIIPPVYAKQFEGTLFRKLWQETVRVLSTANEVRFLGFSLAEADFHAKFVLRCGFYSQENGQLKHGGKRAAPTGRSKVIIVDPSDEPHKRIQRVVGWECASHKNTISAWIADGGLP